MTRPMSAEGLREEAQCELVAIGHELLKHDIWEMATYDAMDALIAAGQAEEARELLAKLRRRDIEENKAHRAIVANARAVAS